MSWNGSLPGTGSDDRWPSTPREVGDAGSWGSAHAGGWGTGYQAWDPSPQHPVGWGDKGSEVGAEAKSDTIQSGTSSSDPEQGAVVLGPPATPPLVWLGVAGLLVVAGFVVFLLGEGATMGLVGWVLAGPAAMTALGVFVTQDARRAQTGWYRPSSAADWGRRAVVVLALVAVALNAFLIANDVARGMWR